MVIGRLFAFPASFEEFARALFLTTPKTITLQVKIWRSLKYEVSPVVAVVSTPQILFILVVVGGGMLARRHLVPGKGEPL
jgi:putative spermidine/putrescine transport system permease protein